MKSQDCPKCFGTGQIMEAKKNKKGFEYKKCDICNGKGIVHPDIADDFIFSLNEDNFETNDDW